MGQQIAENQLLRSLSAAAAEGWLWRRLRVTSLRSPLTAERRLPMGLMERLPLGLQRVITRPFYGRADLYHRLDLRLPAGPGRELLTVHDLAPLRFEDEGSLPRSALRSIRDAAGVVCPSRFAAEEVRHLAEPRRVFVVPNGVNPAFAAADPLNDASLARLGLRRPFILHAGGCSRRKNLAGLAEGWATVARSFPSAMLALVGPPDPRRDQVFAAASRARRLGSLSLPTLAGLMHSAAAVVVPSVYEGFGLPALEAMACGVPVVAASAGALPEICAGAAILVEPTGPALAAGMLAALQSAPAARVSAERGPARAAGFTWPRAAMGYLEAYASVLSEP